MKKPIKQWLETIADPTIREAAISQIDESNSMWPEDGMAKSLADALLSFNDWDKTKELRIHWRNISNLALRGQLETREVEATKPRKNSIIDTWLDKNVFTFNSSDYTKTEQEDGTIILKPKKVKVWIEVYKTHSNKMETLIHFNKQQLEDSINDGKNFGETLLEVIEREYEI